jgi:hypothetical protein
MILYYRLVRRSLGDEIQRLGVLGSPFCDKIKSISPGKLNESVNENLRNSPKEIRICSDKTVKLDGCLETINENQCPEQTFEEEERKGMLAKRFLRSFSSMFISIVQTISFLSFSRCPSNPRFKVYFQKVFIMIMILTLQILHIVYISKFLLNHF